MPRSVAALVGGEVSAFELGVVAEVFGLDRRADGLPHWDFAVCAVTPGPVPTSTGFAVHVEHDLGRAREADLLVVPSWRPDAEVPDVLARTLHDAVRRDARVLAVCSGAFLLAAVDLLDGRRAATHWRYADALAAAHPAVTVDADVLYVVDGPIMTSAGTAAAIDACLHVVRLDHGSAAATAVARRMVVAPHRDGGQAQFAARPVLADQDPDVLGPLLRWARDHLAAPLTVRDLAARAGMSPRSFARHFVAVTGTTPHRWVLAERLARAEELLEGTRLSIDRIAEDCGLGSADTLRHHFARRRRTSPTRWRQRFGSGGGQRSQDAGFHPVRDSTRATSSANHGSAS